MNNKVEYVKEVENGAAFTGKCDDCGAVVKMSADDLIVFVEDLQGRVQTARVVAGVFVCENCREMVAAHAAAKMDNIEYGLAIDAHLNAIEAAREHADSVAIWQKAQRQK